MFRIPSSLRFIGRPSRQVFSSKGKLLISGVLELLEMVVCVLKMNVRQARKLGKLIMVFYNEVQLSTY